MCYGRLSIHVRRYSQVPTISRMRVSMDESGVEYLLRKGLYQFVCGLKKKQKTKKCRWKNWAMMLHARRRAFCRVHPLTSFKLNPCLLISSTLLILQPLQNSAVNTLWIGDGKRRTELWLKKRWTSSCFAQSWLISPYLYAPRRLWEHKQNQSVSDPRHTSLSSWLHSQSPALELTYPSNPTEK